MNDDSDVLKCIASLLSFDFMEFLTNNSTKSPCCFAVFIQLTLTLAVRHVSHFIEPECRRKKSVC
jgi:hypothetical protein